jgi:pyruvate dehydrogenase E2 component (dihydrolipoamide acetyltransferase)
VPQRGRRIEVSRPFKLPDLGEGIHEAEVVAILVKEGDRVQEGQPFMEVETDKARVQLPSPVDGTVEAINVRQDDTVKVGTVLVVFGDGSAPAGAAGEPAPARSGTSPSGDAQAETASQGGSPAAPASPLEGAKKGGPIPASPATRRLARELGVDLKQVPASGPAGLVTAQDVRTFAERALQQGETPGEQQASIAPEQAPAAPETFQEGPASLGMAAPAVPPVEDYPLPDFGRWGRCEKVPLRSVRRATARHMAVAWSQVPHVNHQEAVDITRLESYRKEHQSEVAALGGRLTITVFVMKAVVAALKSFPRFNCSLDMRSEEIIVKHYYHLGVAVDTERGLVVPVVRDVDRKSIADLSVELKSLAERARAGETALEEMQGGTFTITNIGAIGGTGFSPIINYPEVAILGMGRAQMQPVVLGEDPEYQVVPRLMMPLVLAFDHRVADGADAARFTRMVKESLENPNRLWLRI